MPKKKQPADGSTDVYVDPIAAATDRMFDETPFDETPDAGKEEGGSALLRKNAAAQLRKSADTQYDDSSVPVAPEVEPAGNEPAGTKPSSVAASSPRLGRRPEEIRAAAPRSDAGSAQHIEEEKERLTGPWVPADLYYAMQEVQARLRRMTGSKISQSLIIECALEICFEDFQREEEGSALARLVRRRE